MPLVDQTRLRNTLQRRSSPEDFALENFALLAPHLEPRDRPKSKVLIESDQPFTAGA